MRTLSLFGLLLVPACTSTPNVKLADLKNVQIAGTETGFGLNLESSAGCPQLSSDVHGTVDGAPLTIYDGGEQNAPDADYCAGINIEFPAALANNAVTSIELTDGDTTWHFGVEKLAPPQWTVSAPLDAVEGSDVTVGWAPTVTGVELDWVFIQPSKIYISPFEGQPAPGSNTVHIDAGYWSDEDEPGSGQPVPGTLSIQVGPLAVDGCPVGSCTFATTTNTQPITIVVP